MKVLVKLSYSGGQYSMHVVANKKNSIWEGFSLFPEDGCSQLITMRRTWDCGMFSIIWDIHITSLPQGSGDFTEEGVEGLDEPEEKDEVKNTAFSGHNKAVEHMNSQWLWQCTQGLCKFKPDKNPKMDWRTQNLTLCWGDINIWWL